MQGKAYYKGGSEPQYTMMSLQKSESSVAEHNKILCNLGYRGMNLMYSSKSIVTGTNPTMWIDELKSNIEGIQQNVNEWVVPTIEAKEFTNKGSES